jgi:hypothetical protein
MAARARRIAREGSIKLYNAARDGNDGVVVSSIRDARVDLNATNDDGQSAIYAAAGTIR